MKSSTIEIHRVRLLDHEPVSLELTWRPPAIGKRLANADRPTRDILLILERASFAVIAPTVASKRRIGIASRFVRCVPRSNDLSSLDMSSIQTLHTHGAGRRAVRNENAQSSPTIHQPINSLHQHVVHLACGRSAERDRQPEDDQMQRKRYEYPVVDNTK